MGWKISPRIAEILHKGSQCGDLTKEEALTLLQLDLHSLETYALMETADTLSRELFKGKGENHFHIGLDARPCPFSCRFCSFAKKTGTFSTSVDFTEEEVLRWAREAKAHGADALNIMTTGAYPFERLLEIGRLLKKDVSVPLVANTRDINHREGEQLLDAGFVGAYHAVRLGEGRDTPFRPEKRLNSIKIYRDVGLLWMNCVEPVGPEHSLEEIVKLMFLAKSYKATYSGVMRRINFPGSPMESYGMISELEMARMVAVSRLVMADVPKAHCTHEPNTLSLISGANLLFPEVGSSPRDNHADTEENRGFSISRSQAMGIETGWDPGLPSNCFQFKAQGSKMEDGR